MRLIVTPFIVALTATSAFAAEGGGFPPFDSSTFAGQLFWLTITFGTLYLLMSRVALPRIASILGARQSTIETALTAASSAQKAAEAEALALEQALAKAKTNAQAIAIEARSRSAKEIDAKRHVVESELSARMIAAETEITATKAKAMANVEDIARDAVSAIIEQLTGKAPTAAEIARALAPADGK